MCSLYYLTCRTQKVQDPKMIARGAKMIEGLPFNSIDVAMAFFELPLQVSIVNQDCFIGGHSHGPRGYYGGRYSQHIRLFLTTITISSVKNENYYFYSQY